jgi:hypothetical protein
MLDELLVNPPRVRDVHQEWLLIQADQVQQGDMQLATPSDDEIRAADRVFSQEKKNDDGLTAIVGVATSMIVLHDMAVDRFSTNEEDEEQPKPKDKPEEK